jgi:hypothetical protein
MSWSLAKQRSELAAWWLERDPVVPRGGLAVEEDTGRTKIGDGRLHFSELVYVDEVAGDSAVHQEVPTVVEYGSLSERLDAIDQKIVDAVSSIPAAPATGGGTRTRTASGDDSLGTDGLASFSSLWYPDQQLFFFDLVVSPDTDADFTVLDIDISIPEGWFIGAPVLFPYLESPDTFAQGWAQFSNYGRVAFYTVFPDTPVTAMSITEGNILRTSGWTRLEVENPV